MLLSKNSDLSLSHIKSEIEKDWHKLMLDAAKQRMLDQSAKQLKHEVHDSLNSVALVEPNADSSGGTGSSGGTSSSGGKHKSLALAHLKQFPKSAQHKWHESRLKEFKSNIGKEAAEIIDESQLLLNAIVIPSQFIYKLKGDSTMKSRLVLLGHLMPKDGEIDLASPAPQLSTLHLILPIAIKMDLAVHIIAPSQEA